MRSLLRCVTATTTRAGTLIPAASRTAIKRPNAIEAVSQTRFFASSASTSSSPASPKLASSLQSELQYEQSSYERAENITTFLERSGWTLTEKEGDVNMVLKKSVGDLQVGVEFQLVSPTYTGDEDEEGGSGGVEPQETTDFAVTVEKAAGNGAIFYCTTVGNDDKFRFIVGNVRYFANAEEKSSVSAYTGPEFEDLDENLQTGVDEWLSSLGINEELCDFVDAMAVDKEQREYMRWLSQICKIVQ